MMGLRKLKMSKKKRKKFRKQFDPIHETFKEVADELIRTARGGVESTEVATEIAWDGFKYAYDRYDGKRSFEVYSKHMTIRLVQDRRRKEFNHKKRFKQFSLFMQDNGTFRETSEFIEAKDVLPECDYSLERWLNGMESEDARRVVMIVLLADKKFNKKNMLEIDQAALCESQTKKIWKRLLKDWLSAKGWTDYRIRCAFDYISSYIQRRKVLS